jgi:hypothetical protein
MTDGYQASSSVNALWMQLVKAWKRV